MVKMSPDKYAVYQIILVSVIHFGLYGQVNSIKNTVINYQLQEELPPNTLISPDIASKAGLKHQYSESILKLLRYNFAASPSALFNLNQNSGLLKTSTKIDREEICPRQTECIQTVVIAVSPTRYFQLITVKIDILDENDNTPTFTDTKITVKVSESTPVGKVIAVLPSARDLDSGIFGVVKYELMTHQHYFNFFTLKEKEVEDGSTELKLILNKKLDRETISSYQLELLAFDGDDESKSGQLFINVTVQDTNDNPPIFKLDSYAVNVAENKPIQSTILKVSASDSDIGANGEIVFDFTRRTNENFGRIFGINPTLGEIYLKKELNFENETEYKLVVTAKDKGADTQTAQTVVIVKVIDINDCTPNISINTFTASGQAEVPENVPVGTVLSYVTVEDNDSGKRGEVNCGLTISDFRMNYVKNTKWQYTIVTTSILDRETKSHYVIGLSCEDKGRPVLSSNRSLSVIVLDENDHTPRFSKRSYTAKIEEGNSPHEYILQAKASDEDIGKNKRLKYYLSNDKMKDLNDLFEIDNTGTLRAKISLDHEMYSSVTFNIVVEDHGTPPRNSTARVDLEIIDVNDCKPEFSDNNYSFGIYENKIPGSDAGNVAASDDDSKDYNKIAYQLDLSADDKSALDHFGIDEEGYIRSKVSLDREEQSFYHLRVIAYNPGFPGMSSTATVTIYVLDKNDNDPIIDFPSPSNFTVQLRSDVSPGYVITRIRAHDIDFDEQAKLTFNMLEDNNTLFSVDPTLGAVTLIDSFDFSRYTKWYNLTILVKDLGKDEQRNATAVLVIQVRPSHIGKILSSNEEFIADYTIVIGLTCGSLCVIGFLMLAIIWLSCKGKKTRKPEQGKYNCRVEAQRMLNGRLDRPLDTRESSTTQSTPSISCSMGQPVTTQDEVHIVLNHDDSGRGVSLMEYNPNHMTIGKSGVKTWPQTKTETQPGLSPSNHSDMSPKSPMTDKTSIDSTQNQRLPVCNSCVVTSDNDRFATKLVPLTDKEIEIHKILKFLHSQQDDTVQDGQCSDSMSTSDSGKGASVSEECEPPAYNTLIKPNKQVTFYNLPKTNDHHSKHSHQPKKGGQMTTFSASSPQGGTTNNRMPLETNFEGTSPVKVFEGDHNESDKGRDGRGVYLYDDNNKDSSQNKPIYINQKEPPPYKAVQGNKKRGPNNYRKQDNLPLSYYNKHAGVGNIPVQGRVVDDDNDNLSDADTTSTMSGSYVLAHDDTAARLDFNRLRDSVV